MQQAKAAEPHVRLFTCPTDRQICTLTHSSTGPVGCTQQHSASSTAPMPSSLWCRCPMIAASFSCDEFLQI